ncbi:alpha/beta hydrolase [Arthrobacter sp. UYCu712]|uniref:alpha/beta fold hydrolase n=1 Tax=Arthrobacter sp. UYCu712 TaxID=3156340 RepID=UPI00339A20BA
MYAEDFALHGEQAFTGAFNWYRNIERNNELLAPFRGRGIDVPALYLVGDRDMVTSLSGPGGLASLTALVPGLHDAVVLPGCGHWTQQERPGEVNAALLEFLAGIDGHANPWHDAEPLCRHHSAKHILDSLNI